MSLAQPSSRPDNGSESPLICDCTHCGLPVPPGLVKPAADEQFCCAGCKMAYRLIHASGLSAFYVMAESNGADSALRRRESGIGSRFEEFDQPFFLSQFGKSLGDGRNEITLVIDGIHCAACVWLLEKLPQIVPGVIEVQLSWARKTARLRWHADQVPLSTIARTLHQLGYTPHPVRENESALLRRNENRRHWTRIGIAAAAAGNNMLIATALYLGMFSYMSVGMNQMLRIASCLVGLASLLWPGRVFLSGAINAIRTRTPHMDLPIALGLTIGCIAGVINTIRGTGEIYFDSLSVLIFLLLIGRWIQFRQQNRAADAVEMLYRLTPKMTRKVIDGRTVEMFVDLVQPGDLIEIRPGELVPVDAEIVTGTTQVDESILSGESRLLRKTVGDSVLAGTQNCDQVLVARATATGRETRLSKIVELVEQASLDKPAIVEWANRIGGYFVMAVIGLALATLLAWLMIDAAVAVDRTVALLIVACPCALALATPLAISVALGRAANRKIMIKGGDVLQHLTHNGMIWLDKTGTLTEGRLEVTGWFGDLRWRPLIGVLESKSTHPVATAIIQVCKTECSDEYQQWLDCEGASAEATHHIGLGVSGRVGPHHLLVGNAKLLLENGVAIQRRHQRIADSILRRNLSPCWVAANGQVVGVLALGDAIRSQTQSAINQLKAQGWQVGILSGDHERIVEQVAERLGISKERAIGGRSPEEKVQCVRESFVDHETVVMVGDGVNDSAALAAASVGIAVHNSAEASLAAAPVYLAEEGLEPILELVRISKSTGSTIRNNFTASIGYNLFGATFAAVGLINPLVAAILMPISSLTVLVISLSAGKTIK